MDRRSIRAKGLASCHQGVLQGIKIGEDVIGHRFVDQGPEPFGGLQLGGIGGKAHQVDPIRDHHLGTGVPPGTVPDEDDAMRGGDAFIADEGGQGGTDCVRRDRRQQTPPTLAGRGTDQSVDPQPLIAAITGGNRTFANGCPDPALERNQSQPVFILGPEGDDRPGIG